MRSSLTTTLLILLLLAPWATPTAIAKERSKHPVPVPAGTPATVLLITDESLAPAWRVFADWKTGQGKATRILTVQQIEKSYEGVDTPAKIRACVLDQIDNHGTHWVILGGDSEPGGKGLVPDRDTRHVVMGRMKYADIPTDLYYLSTGDWDANDDGIYGQWQVDKDAIQWTHPKACIGRIPVRTKADVLAYTDKVIGYESRYPAKDFAGRMVYTCPERMAYPKLSTSRKSISADWAAGELLQYFADKTPWDKKTPGDHALSPKNLAKLINEKSVGKFHVHGHGFLPVWVLEGHETWNASHVATLVNENAYPIVTTVSCFTGQYDGKADPSIIESMLRRPKGGAIAVIAPSREGVPIFADRADYRLMITEGKMDGTTETLTNFWRHGLSKNLTVGEAFSLAKADMAQRAREHAGYHWVQSELNLLGDPTLDMRAKDPLTPMLKVEMELTGKGQSVLVETGVAGATVCVWQGARTYQVLTADPDGKASFETSASPGGDLQVTVSGPNLNVVTTSIRVER